MPRRWPRLGRLVCAAAIVGALVACTTPGAGSSPAGPRLNFLVSFPTSLDPDRAGGGDTALFLDNIFSGLVRYTAGGDLVPDLASRWTISPDRTVYTFALRDNATFHNGDPVTAASIAYAINRACDPTGGAPVAGDYLGTIQGVRERLAGQASTVSGVSVEDRHTLRITLIHPDAAFLAKLTFPLTFALDERTVAAGGANWWQHPNGSGPFRLTAWQPDSAATLTRNDRFYGPLPQAATVVLHNPAAVSNPTRAFSTGELDLLPLPPTAQDMASFLYPQATVPPQVRQAFHVLDIPALQYLVLSATTAPFDDVNMRRAVNFAIDRSMLVTAGLGGDGWPAGAILPPEIAGYERNTKAYPFGLPLAKAAVAASRYAATVPTLTLASGERLPNGQPGPLTSALAGMIQQNLGWHVTLQYVPDAEINAALQSGHPPAAMTLTGWQADYADPSDFLDLLFHSGRSTNIAHYSNPQVDQLLDEADQTADDAQRIRLYRQAQMLILRDAPIVPLFFQRAYVLLNPRVRSLPLLPDGSYDVRDAIIS